MIKSVPSSHSEVRDGVVVGLEDLGVVENFVSERVESVQGHSDVGGRHPVLQETQGGRTVRHIRQQSGLSVRKQGNCSLLQHDRKVSDITEGGDEGEHGGEDRGGRVV